MFLAREAAYMRILDIANTFEIRKAAASSAVSRVKRQTELDAKFNQTHRQSHIAQLKGPLSLQGEKTARNQKLIGLGVAKN